MKTTSSLFAALLLLLSTSSSARDIDRWQKALDRLTQHVVYEGPIREEWMIGVVETRTEREVLYWECDNCGIRRVGGQQQRRIITEVTREVGDINLGSPVRLRPMKITEKKGDQLVLGMPLIDTGKVQFLPLVAYISEEQMEAVASRLERPGARHDLRKEGPVVDAMIELTNALAPVVVANGVDTFLIHEEDGIDLNLWRWNTFDTKTPEVLRAEPVKTRFPQLLSPRVVVEATIPIIGVNGRAPVLPLDRTSELYLPASIEQGVIRHLALQEQLLSNLTCDLQVAFDRGTMLSPMAQRVITKHLRD